MTYDVVIVGGGPAGLSAAAHAAQTGMSHVLLEATGAHANTVQRYQKGKHVMAEPGVVPLRSELEFTAGTREAVLGAWEQGIEKLSIDVCYEGEVTAIRGERPGFEISLANGEKLKARSVVFARRMLTLSM